MGKFFRTSIQIVDDVVRFEMLVFKNYNMDFLCDLTIEQAILTLQELQDIDIEEHLYLEWLTRLPHFTKDDYLTFGEFLEKVRPKKTEIDNRPTEVIVAELMELKKTFEVIE